MFSWDIALSLRTYPQSAIGEKEWMKVFGGQKRYLYIEEPT